MAGRLINGIKYIGLMNDNSLKSKSLEDNVYFTLRDIFWNGDCDDLSRANYYSGLLTNNISFEMRNDSFEYTNLLHDENSDFTQKLYNWLTRSNLYDLNLIKLGYFDFDEPEEDEEINMDHYMKYDDWWVQFEDLLNKLKSLLDSRKN